MGKASKILATWLVITWNVVAQWESLAAHNQLSNQQNKTKSELFVNFSNPTSNESTFYLDWIISPSNQVPSKYTWIYAGFETNPESLDWQKIYNINVSEVPSEILKYGMLRKMNEIRKTHWLKPLKYDKKLEKVAQDFANDDRNYDRWNNPYPHADSKWRWVKTRLQDAGLLWSYIELITVDYTPMWYGENMWSISGHTINSLYNDWMNSPWHREQIVSKYHNAVWFGISAKWNVIIHEFWNVKK